MNLSFAVELRLVYPTATAKLSGVLPTIQCAAVTIWRLLTRVPPQKWADISPWSSKATYMHFYTLFIQNHGLKTKLMYLPAMDTLPEETCLLQRPCRWTQSLDQDLPPVWHHLEHHNLVSCNSFSFSLSLLPSTYSTGQACSDPSGALSPLPEFHLQFLKHSLSSPLSTCELGLSLLPRWGIQTEVKHFSWRALSSSWYLILKPYFTKSNYASFLFSDLPH